jgi:hypothetical protein
MRSRPLRRIHVNREGWCTLTVGNRSVCAEGVALRVGESRVCSLAGWSPHAKGHPAGCTPHGWWAAHKIA